MLEFDLDRLRRRKPEPAKRLHMFPGWHLLHHSAPRYVPDDKDLTWCSNDTIEINPKCFDNNKRFDLTIVWVDAFEGWGLFWGDRDRQHTDKGWNFGLAWSACDCVRARNCTGMYESYALAHKKIVTLESAGFCADSIVNLGVHVEQQNWHDLVQRAEHTMMQFLSELENREDTWWNDDINTKELRDGLLGDAFNKHTDDSTPIAIVKRLGDIWKQPYNENRG